MKQIDPFTITIKLTRVEDGFWLYVEAGGVGSGYPLTVHEAKKL